MKLKTKQRVFSVLLALAIILSLLPPNTFTIFAAETDDSTSSNYGSYIGNTAEFAVDYGNYPVSDNPIDVDNPWGPDCEQLFSTEVSNGLLLVIVDYYYNAESGNLWYMVQAAPGHELPEKLHSNPWVFQDNMVSSSGGNSLIIHKSGTNVILDSNGNVIDLTEGVDVPKFGKVTMTAQSTLQGSVSYQWQICYDRAKDLWVDIYGENEASIKLSYGMVASLIDENGLVNVRCETKCASKMAYSAVIPVSVDSTSENTTFEPSVEIQIDGISADSVTTTFDNESFEAKLTAATNISGILSYQWEVLSDVENDLWTEISAGESCTVKYSDLDFVYNDASSDVSFVKLTVTNGYHSASDTFIVYRIASVYITGSSESDSGKVDVTVSGNLPEGASLDLVDASSTEIGGVDATEIALALDVSIMQNGTEWQPGAGESVRVSIPASQLGLQDGNCFTVYHIHDGATELLGPFVVTNGYATFEIDGFSVVVISTNYGASIGATAELSQQLLLLYPEPNSLSSTMAFYTDLPENLIITDYYFDSDNARLLYKIDAAPGYAWPEAFANVHWCESSDLSNINVNGTAGVFDANGNPVDDAAVSTSAGVVVSAITSLQSADITYKWQICYDTENDLWVNISGENDADITIVAGMVMSLMDENNQVKVRCVTSAGSKTVITEPIIITLTEPQPGNDTVDILIDGAVAENVNISGSDLASFDSTLSASTTLTGDLTYSWEVLFDKYYDMWWLQGQSATFNPVFDPYGDGVYLDSNFIHAVDDTTSEVCIRLTVSNGATTVRNTFVINVNNEETAAAVSYSPARRRIATFSANSGIATVDDNTTIYKIVINYLYYHNMETAASPYTSTVGSSTQITDPVEFPTVRGYLPYVMDEDGNLVRMDSYKFSGLLTEDFELTVYYKPTTVSYTINIYTQNAEDDNYQLLMTRTGSALTGTVIDTISMPLSGYYQTKMTSTTASVAADGSTVFNLYYDRIYYLMKFDLDGGYGVQPIYARHGVKLDITSPVKAGYTFVGWDNTTTGTGDGIADTLPATMPIGNTTYKAIWKAADVAKVTIVYWGENPNDEKYSYLESSEIYVKPGTSLTFDTNEPICGIDEHTHNTNCDSCGNPDHNHSEAAGCYGACTHATHDVSCYTTSNLNLVSSLGNNSNERNAYNRLIQLLNNGNTDPVSGNVYRSRRSNNNNTNYNFFYLNGTWYYLGTGNTYKNIGHASIDNPSYNRYTTAAATTRCSHTHTDTCLSCTQHTHTADCYDCIEHTHTDSCYLRTNSLNSALWTYVESDDVTVAADGSTVMNVYYDRTTFTLTFRSGSNTVATITDKWGASISGEFGKAPFNTTYNGRAWKCTETNKYNYALQTLDIMPQFNATFNLYDQSSTTLKTIYYYIENVGANVSSTTWPTSTTNFTLLKTVQTYFNYATYQEEYHEMVGFTRYTASVAGFRNNQKDFNNNNALYLYYLRDSFMLEFSNGEDIVSTRSVEYQANLGSYAFTPTAPSFYEAGSVEFAGWYQNPECTGDEVVLSETTMPSSNKILYAKWMPVSHDVTIYRYKNADGTFPSGNDIIQETIQVPHGSFLQQQYIPADPDNLPYTFVGWFYMDGNTEKAFDFVNMPVTKDLKIYAKWSSNSQIPYTIKYVLQGTDTEIADRETGKQFAGETLTFQAKTGGSLYTGYQLGYYPTLASHSISFDLNDNVTSYEFTFEYVKKESVPYTVYYLSKTLNEGTVSHGTMEYNGETYYKIFADKTVNSTNAIVTENFVQVAGYMPNAYQQSLVLSGADDAVNEMYFIYTVDTIHAYYKVSHYTQNLDGSWYEYSTYESVGVIGSIYTEGARTITGFTYDPSISGTLTTGTLTAEGLHLQLYYTRNKYPYKVEYRIDGAGTLLDTEYFTTEALMQYYNQTISVSPNRTFNGYHLVSNSPITQIIQIEQDANMQDPVANVIIFYYAEDEVTINYEVVGPTTGCGTVTPSSQTVAVITGNPMSSADPSSAVYKFVGWYTDAACTQLVTVSRVITPEKVNGLNVAATYYAKFEYNLTALKIVKNGWDYIDSNQSFLFHISGNDLELDVVFHGNDFVIIDGLTVGETYKVTEIVDWSWRYGDTPDWRFVADGDTVKTGTDTAVAEIVLGATGNEITFANTRDQEKWLDGDTWVDNCFKN